MSSPSLAIEATGLVKTFGETRAVDGVDLAVRRGSVYGVLGPNGAGKTTTIRMLATLLRPDAGSARVLGHDVVKEADKVRGLVSLTGQMASVDEDLTGRENMYLNGSIIGFSRADIDRLFDEIVEFSELGQFIDLPVKHYSSGMVARLGFSIASVSPRPGSRSSASAPVPKWMSRSSSAVERCALAPSIQARLVPSVEAPTPPRTPITADMTCGLSICASPRGPDRIICALAKVSRSWSTLNGLSR